MLDIGVLRAAGLILTVPVLLLAERPPKPGMLVLLLIRFNAAIALIELLESVFLSWLLEILRLLSESLESFGPCAFPANSLTVHEPRERDDFRE
jgi:hypothetical protein